MGGPAEAGYPAPMAMDRGDSDGMPAHLRIAKRLAAACLMAALATAPARAHSELRRSSPAQGAVLSAPPATVDLVFNERVQLTALRLRGPDGREIALPERHRIREAQEESLRLPPLGPGEHRIEWRAISGDGHPVGGTIAFRIAPAAR
jgi:methionine-rich copper-binding protein CopC